RHPVHARPGRLAGPRLAPAQLRLEDGHRRHAQVARRRVQPALAADAHAGSRRRGKDQHSLEEAGDRMKVARMIVVVAACSLAAMAQPKAKTPADQRYFNLVNIVQRPVGLSDVELAALANDDLMRKFSPASAGSKLTQEGLEATVVPLCGADERDLIVIGNGESYATTYTGPFWIIREPATGPVVALSESSLS